MGKDAFVEFGRTEIIWNNLNPDFVKKFKLDYFFEERQELKFELYDMDSKDHNLQKHDYLGEVQCSLGEICSSQKLKLPIKYRSKSNCGTMILSAEEVGESRDVISLQFKAEGLDKMDLFGKSDPFLVFYRQNDDGQSFTITHKTEKVKRTLNPTWKPFTIPVMALCGNDYDRILKVECWDWNMGGSHDLIGEFTTTMRQLTRGVNMSNVYEVINFEKKKKKSKYNHSGTVLLEKCQVHPRYSFLDYIRGGTEIHTTIAIDFTSSNGKPNEPGSLHFLHGDTPNIYEKVLRTVGRVLEDYDSTKKIPGLGFGARIPPDGKVAFDFFLNGHPNNPYCRGINGVIDAYKHALNTVYLHGPTNFAPVIRHVSTFADNHKEGHHYFVLLIITDGSISDMARTKDAIVEAATLPMSIVIVGVGDEDFSAMEELDGDNVRVTGSDGTAAVRDIVQFVCFRDFLDANNDVKSKSRLAREVLEEIPDQFLDWMTMHEVKPRNLPTVKPMSYNTIV
uniref:Copine-8-like n=1 Tax=Saccoglossus kowalevskii TaxID=10224 RepID=A0ABM0GLI1_SACKO|nr:PREDICTED: copine-8-like [Saccoglossus kowalevskii]